MILAPEVIISKTRQDFEALFQKMQDPDSGLQRIDQAERELMSHLLNLGKQLLELYVASRGTGDVGPTLEVQDEVWNRLDQLHPRRYVSIFGELEIDRTVYGTRETQKFESVPLDAELGLPEGDFSYVLQDWLQRMCVQNSYGESVASLQALLGVSVSVRSAEAMNQAMAHNSDFFRYDQPAPPLEEEGSILVVTADGKGVVMRRPDRPEPSDLPASSPAAEAVTPSASAAAETDISSGKKGTKRMAYVGAVYSIQPFVRTADDILRELNRREPPPTRPAPRGKRLWVEMTEVIDGESCDGRAALFGEMEAALSARNPGDHKTVVCVMDGERALWKVQQVWLPDAVCILDLFHATERLWTAAHLFHRRGSGEAREFVEARLRMLLEGKVGYVIGGFRQMITKGSVTGAARKTLQEVIGYYENNRAQMRYDEYLSRGYPIGSGVAEGACRHLVKDRMERTGMRWRRASAQAMLYLRAIYINGDWSSFQEYRIQKEQKTLYYTAA